MQDRQTEHTVKKPRTRVTWKNFIKITGSNLETTRGAHLSIPWACRHALNEQDLHPTNTKLHRTKRHKKKITEILLFSPVCGDNNGVIIMCGDLPPSDSSLNRGTAKSPVPKDLRRQVKPYD